MAKKEVMPPAELEARASDVDLPLHLLPRLTPFSQLKAALSLDKFPGTCKLRFFRAGEPVCVHGEPGWSAFCFVPASEIAALRDHAVKCLNDGPANRDKTAAAVAKLEADHEALKRQLGQRELPDKDKKDLEKKQDSAKRELEKQQAALALLDEEMAKLPEVQRRFDAWLDERRQESASATERRQQATETLPRLIERARSRGDAARLSILDELVVASADGKRQLADLLEPTEPELARCLHTLAGADGSERVAVTRLPRLRPQAAPVGGWLQRLRRWLSAERPRSLAPPAVIPGEGPRDLDYHSRLSSLYDGDLVGEISCLNRTPRSASIVMVRDGFVVELMRNILDKVSRDAATKPRVEAAERQRLLRSALREIPMFAELPEAELSRIAGGMDFQAYEPGSLICDQHEEADSLYVIGNGIIKVVTGVSWLLPADAAIDAAGLRQELTAPDARHAEARSLLSALLVDTDAANFVRALNRIITQPSWRDTPAVRAVVQAEKLVPRVWRLLATSEHNGAGGLLRCNRLLLQALDAQAYPAFKPGATNAETAEVFRLQEFAATDWKKFCSRLVADDKKPEDAARTVWDRLPAAAQDRLRHGKTTELTPADKETIVAGLNAVLHGELLLLTGAGYVAQTNANLATQLLPMLADGQLWGDYDYQRWGRCLNRLVLETLCPKTLGGLSKPSGLPHILAYRSRNEVLGEIGLLARQPRTATLVTYNHPKNDPKREVGQVHLFRLGKAFFDDMVQRHPGLRARLEALAAERLRPPHQRPPAAAGQVDGRLLHSPRGEQLGLVEGQRLMLIDLDRCTRCDECVRACVNTHDDGRSRLFLVGPRHGQYLVPATCRACLDPVCMIGCPVNSIQRGDNKEIVIRDWCIGCEKCADQCPYGSIQMHDIGLVRAAAHDWRYAPVPADEAWTRPNFDDRKWPADRAPFADDTTLEQRLARLPGYAPRGPVAFRHTFRIAKADYQKDCSFLLELAAPGDQAKVWLNGEELRTEEKPRQGKRQMSFGPAHKYVGPGDNVLAVLVPRPAQVMGQTFFTLRLDVERDPDSATVEIKQVTARAVVCDLCSSLPTGPACVTACPHEAAMRVNAVAVKTGN